VYDYIRQNVNIAHYRQHRIHTERFIIAADNSFTDKRAIFLGEGNFNSAQKCLNDLTKQHVINELKEFIL